MSSQRLNGQEVFALTYGDGQCTFSAQSVSMVRMRVRQEVIGIYVSESGAYLPYGIFRGYIETDGIVVEVEVHFKADGGMVFELPTLLPGSVRVAHVSDVSAELVWPDQTERTLLREQYGLWSPETGFLEGRIGERLFRYCGSIV